MSESALLPASLQPPDIVLLAVAWESRAPLRAQLIEEGWDVVAVDTWPAMRRSLRPHVRPQLAFVDLKDLPDPQRVLEDLAILMKPARVCVLTALATVQPSTPARLGFRVLHRPIAIEQIVSALTSSLRQDAKANAVE
ncbi:MAG TPA: hypothetical protein VLV86_20205 [Vicinamibacterales bacterium]|nr:hypothetical protein [Vicinamibacterales bacterium]